MENARHFQVEQNGYKKFPDSFIICLHLKKGSFSQQNPYD